MRRAERLQTVLAILADRGRVDVADLVKILDVSPATARRDLDTLAEQRMLTRTHGGAIGQSVAYDLPIRYKNYQFAEAKEKIARTASALVPPGSVVGLTGGTTTTALCEELASRADIQQTSATPNLTVVTNAVNIAVQLATRPQVKVLVAGGVLNSRSYELVGGFVEQVLRATTLDFAFIGVNGLDPILGASTHDEREATASRLMASRARKSIVVADSSKIGHSTFAIMGGPAQFPTLITDSGITAEQHNALVSQGYQVLIAN